MWRTALILQALRQVVNKGVWLNHICDGTVMSRESTTAPRTVRLIWERDCAMMEQSEVQTLHRLVFLSITRRSNCDCKQ